ncbi:MAG TPA: hypothetical protein PLI22_07235 [Caldisericia bacterium]|nr:hypothetical protein [Caldisericia bacterium]
MYFKEFYTLTENKIPNWDNLVKTNPELKSAVKVLKKINSLGYEALIVGGTPRDLLLGYENFNDVDISTNAPMNVLEKEFKTHSIGKNKDFGVVVVEVDGYNFEIAQYREDFYGDYSKGVGATQTKRVNDFKSDSARRDFQLNSLGVTASGDIIDHWGGVNDILNKKIKAVGDPNQRFKEDLIRPLRAIRQAAKLGFTIDKDTMNAIIQHAPSISKVASERITKELIKMSKMSGSKFADAIELLDKAELLKYILPEVYGLKSMKHNPEHHPESPHVAGHVLACLRSYKGNDSLVNFSILFHDIGKLTTYNYNGGKHSYHGHDSAGVPIIEEVAKRLKLDNNTRDAMIFCAEKHMYIHRLLEMSNEKIFKLMQNKHWDVLLQVAEADARSRGSLFDSDEWNKILQKIENIKKNYANKEQLDKIKKIVNGYKVAELRGMNLKVDGKNIGKIIKSTIEWILNNNISLNNEKEIYNYIMQVDL